MTHPATLRDVGLALCRLASDGDMSGVRAMVDGESIVRRRFLARLVACLAPRAPGAGMVLVTLAQNDAEDVRAEAYDALARCPIELVTTVIEHIRLRRDAEPWVEVSRVRILTRVAPERPMEVARALVIAAEAKERWVQQEVLRALNACWNAAGNVVLSEVEQWLVNPNPDVRETALWWISEVKTASPHAVVRAALRMADDEAPLVRSAAAHVLSVHGLRAPEQAFPVLATLAADRVHWSVRLTACRGLSYWQVAAPFEALAMLKYLVNDPINAIRRIALRQLYRLSREHPALALDTVGQWSASARMRRGVMTTCLRAAQRSGNPIVAAKASGFLSEVRRWSA